MPKRYALAHEGRLYHDQGISISWPHGGQREVVEVGDQPPGGRFRDAVAQGYLVEVDDEPTKPSGPAETPYVLYTGEEARAKLAEPAGPVIFSEPVKGGGTRDVQAIEPPVRSAEPARPSQRPPAVKTTTVSDVPGKADLPPSAPPSDTPAPVAMTPKRK